MHSGNGQNGKNADADTDSLTALQVVQTGTLRLLDPY